MAFWTYLLLCADGKYYTGHTDNLERRFGEHQSGLIKGFTSSRLPVQLVWADYFQTRADAIENELRVKKWSKAKKRALAEQDWDKLSYFSKPPCERHGLPSGVSSSLDTNGNGKDVLKHSLLNAAHSSSEAREVATLIGKRDRKPCR